MNHIYIGDRPLDPPEDDECEICGGCGRYQDWVGNQGDFDVFDCPNCCAEDDPAEPNPYPED